VKVLILGHIYLDAVFLDHFCKIIIVKDEDELMLVIRECGARLIEPALGSDRPSWYKPFQSNDHTFLRIVQVNILP
jgi:hypothetical protein